MVAAKQLLPVLEMVGVVLDPWQVNLMRIHGLLDDEEQDTAPDRSSPQWQRYAMRRLARQWQAEARVMLARGMYERLDDATWSGLQLEAETLRRCADRLLQEVR